MNYQSNYFFSILQVSWIRRKDLHVLTVGSYTYTSDQRFTTIHLKNLDDWTLQVKYPQSKDGGVYECQVSTVPKMSHFVTLNVIGELIYWFVFIVIRFLVLKLELGKTTKFIAKV